jgi:hypothetical protein
VLKAERKPWLVVLPLDRFLACLNGGMEMEVADDHD